MRFCLVFLALALLLTSTPHRAWADDDLMNLMGRDAASDDADEAPQPVAKKSRASALRKLIGKPTAEQNIFIQFFDAGDMARALFQWPSAFEGTAFAKSANGKALSSYLLFKNGIQVYAIENLLAIDRPAEISKYLEELWQEAAPETLAAWSLTSPKLWKPAWTDVFGKDIEVLVRGHQTFQASQLKEIRELIKKSDKSSNERSWLEWQAILAQATGGDMAQAAKSLALLMKAEKNPVGADLMNLTAARLLYQNGFLDAAIKYYEKVPKASDDWFDAQEEMAWAYTRKGEPQNAIALTKTLVNQAFANLVGPETIFVRSLSLLKVCDYPEVATTLDIFRDRYRARAKVLQSVIDQSSSPALAAYVAKAKKTRMSLADLGEEGAKLPRFTTRDEPLTHLIAVEKALENEAAKFGELYAKSLSDGTGKVGFQGRLESLRLDLDRRVLATRAAETSRVKALAEDELGEISQILSKMQIVEAEVIQQVAMSGRVAKATADTKSETKVSTVGTSKGRDLMKWPVDNEVWFDELAHYQVELKKGCQGSKKL